MWACVLSHCVCKCELHIHGLLHSEFLLQVLRYKHIFENVGLVALKYSSTGAGFYSCHLDN